MCAGGGGSTKVKVPKPSPLPPPLPPPAPPKQAPAPPQLLEKPGKAPDIRIGAAKRKSTNQRRSGTPNLSISNNNQGLNL